MRSRMQASPTSTRRPGTRSPVFWGRGTRCPWRSVGSHRWLRRSSSRRRIPSEHRARSSKRPSSEGSRSPTDPVHIPVNRRCVVLVAGRTHRLIRLAHGQTQAWGWHSRSGRGDRESERVDAGGRPRGHGRTAWYERSPAVTANTVLTLLKKCCSSQRVPRAETKWTDPALVVDG